MFVFERCSFVVEPTGEERRGGRGWEVVGFGEGRRDKCMLGSWSKFGLGSPPLSEDELFRDAHKGLIPVPALRGALIKEILRGSPDFPVQFWQERIVRVRRARAKGTLSMLPASFMPHAKIQHRFIDSHPAEDLEFEGKLFYAPNPPFCQPNPTLRYLGENVHCVRALDRILRQITRFFTCGFLRLNTREEFFSSGA